MGGLLTVLAPLSYLNDRVLRVGLGIGAVLWL